MTAKDSEKAKDLLSRMSRACSSYSSSHHSMRCAHVTKTMKWCLCVRTLSLSLSVLCMYVRAKASALISQVRLLQKVWCAFSALCETVYRYLSSQIKSLQSGFQSVWLLLMCVCVCDGEPNTCAVLDQAVMVLLWFGPQNVFTIEDDMCVCILCSFGVRFFYFVWERREIWKLGPETLRLPLGIFVRMKMMTFPVRGKVI